MLGWRADVVATREFSAGGVLVRRAGDGWEVAVINPRGRTAVALPKGHIDPGEKAEQAALREVREETGVQARLLQKLGDVKYVYRFRGKTIFKEVGFFLVEYESGQIDALEAKMRVEVDKAFWVDLAEAEKRLSYPGEREMARKALAALLGEVGKPA